MNSSQPSKRFYRAINPIASPSTVRAFPPITPSSLGSGSLSHVQAADACTSREPYKQAKPRYTEMKRVNPHDGIDVRE